MRIPTEALIFYERIASLHEKHEAGSSWQTASRWIAARSDNSSDSCSLSRAAFISSITDSSLSHQSNRNVFAYHGCSSFPSQTLLVPQWGNVWSSAALLVVMHLSQLNMFVYFLYLCAHQFLLVFNTRMAQKAPKLNWCVHIHSMFVLLSKYSTNLKNQFAFGNYYYILFRIVIKLFNICILVHSFSFIYLCVFDFFILIN